jgi:MFS family permease
MRWIVSFPGIPMTMAGGAFGRALSHRNYRLFLLGQSISLIGTWMQQVATAWLLYRLTGSPLLLGLIGFSSQIPSLFLSPLGGVIADRGNLHRSLLVTQCCAMAQAILLIVVISVEGTIVWPLIALEFLLGVINAFDMPIRQAFLVQMVPNKEHLGNAIALNSSIVNGARLVGPSLAGLIIATWGELACFILNATSYVAVLLAILAMRDLPPQVTRPAARIRDHLREGFAYGFGFAPLRTILLMLSVASFVSMSMNVLMPVFAKDVLHGNAGTQGFLIGASGLGALGAAIYLASRKSVLGLGRIIVRAAIVLGIAQIAFSYSPSLLISLPILTTTGCCMMLLMASSNTLLQTIVEDDKRGRVMSLYSMAFLGVGPIGSLFGGTLANRIGASGSVRISGTIMIVAGVFFAIRLPYLRALVRPIYQKAGILPLPAPLPSAADSQTMLQALVIKPEAIDSPHSV